jgi:molybdopterin-biosynthesis enzyme MoeA-like protein
MAEGLHGRIGEGGALIIVLPGVPREYRSIAGSKAFMDLLPAGNTELLIVDIEFKGRESQVAGRLKELQDRFPEIDVGSYPQGSMSVIIRLTGSRGRVLIAERELKDRLTD